MLGRAAVHRLRAGRRAARRHAVVSDRGADGQPIPSRWAASEEIEALCKAVGDSGRGVIGVNGGTNLSLADCYELQPKVGAPITYTALLTTSEGHHLKSLEVHLAGIAKGAEVWPQVSCRPLAFSMTLVEPFTLNTSPVFAELMPLSLEERRAAYASHEWRDRVRVGWQNKQGLVPRWDSYEIMEASASPDLVGQRLTDIAGKSGSDPFDLLLELALCEPDLQLRVKAMLANDDADGVAILLNAKGCTLGLSDAGAHIGQLCDAVLPTDLLGTWVREKKVLTLEDAIHKLTQVQADLFISLHADAFFTPQASGASVFALSQGAASSAAARWMANKENGADAVGGLNLKVQDQHVQRALLDMSTTAQINDSLKLGVEMLSQIRRVGKLHKPQVEQAGFAVLKAPDIPSLLVETAFISNPQEEVLLLSETYQNQLADALLAGIENYFLRNPPMARNRSM